MAAAAEAEHARLWEGPRDIVPHDTNRPLRPWEQRAAFTPSATKRRPLNADNTVVGSKRARTVALAVAAGDRAAAACVRMYGSECVYRLGGAMRIDDDEMRLDDGEDPPLPESGDG